MKKTAYLLIAALAVCSCGTMATTESLTKGERYSQMYEEKPLVLLVLPPINNSSNVDAKDLLYTSISRPLAESGYYVISPLLAMDILKAESAYDAENFVEGPLNKFKQFFGADAIVFTEINTWAKQGLGIKTDLRMFIKSTTSGDILFDRECDLYLDLSEDSSASDTALTSLLKLAVSVAKTALTDHIQAARVANSYILEDIPRGKYSSYYQTDQQFTAQPQKVSETVSR